MSQVIQLASPEGPALVVAALQSGATLVMPTDTIYGVVAALNQLSALNRLYAAKHRVHKPGTIIAASREQLVALGIDQRELQLAMPYWPGALSLVVPSPADFALIDQETGSIAVRVTAQPWLRDILQQTGPIMTSSANLPGRPPAMRIEDAQTAFGETINYYVDGGYRENTTPSTVVRPKGDTLEVLRAGAVTI